MTLSRSNPRAKPRWAAALITLILGTMVLVTSVLAAPSFTFVGDDEGPNDEPGQKDLTAQSSAFDLATDPDDFYTAWKWDDTSWSGKNTGDACSLFDTDGDGLTNYAVCVTIGTKDAVEQSTRFYSCKDTRSDRCTGAVLEGTEGIDSSASWCSVASATGQFDATDTQATCNISLISDDLGIGGLDNATLLNSCSYPSQEPNSDPSDCVVTITNLNTSVGTLSAGTATWSATLSDTATMSPISATGSVVFNLWQDSSCTVSQWVSGSVNLVSGIASTAGASTTSGTNVITDTTVDADGVYYWTVDYTPSGAFNGSSSQCGEETTITPASVDGAAG
jgi:hypothetical protein